jgi:hypothetical protein
MKPSLTPGGGGDNVGFLSHTWWGLDLVGITNHQSKESGGWNGRRKCTERRALDKVVRVNEAAGEAHLGEMVRSSMEETLYALLDAEAVVGAFPDGGQPALMPVANRLPRIAGTRRGTRRHPDMERLKKTATMTT